MTGPPERPEGSPSEHGEDGTRSELSGSAGDVVQARDISGGVHFHHVRRGDGHVPRQLPGDVRGFVNRVGELARLDRMVAEHANDPYAVTISVIAGTAGVGKTALAVHWAHGARERFPDGQLYVNLRGYDPGLPVASDEALDQFLRALGVTANAIPADLSAKSAQFRSLLADRRMLIVLDNAASVGQVRPLLPGSSTCHVVVTSRDTLPGLAVRDGAQRLTVNILTEEDGIALLRVVTNDYRSEDDPEELAALARLCARLPLALRIAAERAARRPRMPLSDLIQDLRDESALWDALSTDSSEEAETVRTVFAWSYRALPKEAAQLFRLLGLHPGPDFSVAAAAALAGRKPSQVRQLLDTLIGAHLLEQTGSDCYQFHDLLRAYAIDQAHHEESKEDQLAAVRRVLTWYLHAAAAAQVTIRPGGFAFPIDLEPLGDGVEPQTFSDTGDAIRWYEQERANLIAAVRAAAESGFDRITWQIPAVLNRIYVNRDPVNTWLDSEQSALAAARRLGDRYGEAVILDGLGIRLRNSRRIQDAAGQHRAELDIFRELGDQFGQARALNSLGLLHLVERDLDNARRRFEETLAIARELDHRLLVVVSLGNLGIAYYELDRLSEAEALLQEAATILYDLGERVDESVALLSLARVQLELRNLVAANTSLERAMALTRDRQSQYNEGLILMEMGRLEIINEEPGEAMALAHRATTILRQFGRTSEEARALALSGQAYEMLDRHDEAMAFFRQAIALHRNIGDRWWLAVALDNLGAVLDQSDRPDEAQEVWVEALALLGPLSDPRATTLRTRTAERLR